MDVARITADLTHLIQTHQLISIAALVLVIFYCYRNPKNAFKLLVLTVMLVIAGYLLVQLGTSADTGLKGGKELTTKTQKAIDEQTGTGRPEADR